MKKVLWAGVILSAVLSLATVASAGACIDPATGKPVETADGQVMNCAGAEVPADESAAGYDVSAEFVDFGRLTEPGRSYTKTFSITNNSDKKLVVRGEIIKSENAEIKDEYKLASGWMTFVGGVRRFEVPAKSTANISVRVLLPAELTGSTQYATVRLLSEDGVERKVYVRMDVAAEGYRYGGSVTENNLGFVALKETIDGSATVKNDGTAGFEAQYFVQYKNAFGLSDWKTVVDIKRDVAPGTEVHFTTADDGDVAVGYGIFKVEQKIVYVNSENKKVEVMLSHVVVNIPIWLLAVVGGVIVLIILIVVIVKVVRRRKEDDEDDEDGDGEGYDLEAESESEEDMEDEGPEEDETEEEEEPVKPVVRQAPAKKVQISVKKPVAAPAKKMAGPKRKII